MVALPHRSPFYRRATLIYLVAVVGPTLLLVYLGLQSVERQREAIDGLTLTNLRLAGERLAAELELRAMQLAGACLRDGVFRNCPRCRPWSRLPRRRSRPEPCLKALGGDIRSRGSSFGLRELLARIRARLRRPPVGPAHGRYRFGDVEIDFDKFQATRKGQPLELGLGGGWVSAGVEDARLALSAKDVLFT